MRVMFVRGHQRQIRQDCDQRQGGAARWIPSAANSTRHGRMSFDSPTSTMSQPGSGFVYVAFVINAYVRRIVGWLGSRTAHADFVLNALEQALHDRQPAHHSGHVDHSDRGKYVFISRASAWLKLGDPSAGSVIYPASEALRDRGDRTAGSTSSCIRQVSSEFSYVKQSGSAAIPIRCAPVPRSCPSGATTCAGSAPPAPETTN